MSISFRYILSISFKREASNCVSDKYLTGRLLTQEQLYTLSKVLRVCFNVQLNSKHCFFVNVQC